MTDSINIKKLTGIPPGAGFINRELANMTTHSTRRAILAGAAALSALAIPATAAPAPTDPIFAIIDKHRAAFSAYDDVTLRLDEAEGEIEGRPYALIEWRKYNAIGASEIDSARDEFLAEGLDPTIISKEYRAARARYRAQLKAESAWYERHGIAPLRRERNRLERQESDAQWNFISTKPLTLAGLAAMLCYIREMRDGGNDIFYGLDRMLATFESTIEQTVAAWAGLPAPPVPKALREVKAA